MKENIFSVLAEKACKARENSYAPYSHFRVGAALLAKSGVIYTAVNMENSSFPAGVCAETAAFAKAVSEGEREFTAIAVAGGSAGEECFPCGICRQTMAEHCTGDFTVIIVKSPDDYRTIKLSELLPFSFRL